MTVAFLASGIVSGALIVFWLIKAVLKGTTIRTAAIGYKKNRTLSKIHTEGRATRERIRLATRTYDSGALDPWGLTGHRRRRPILRLVMTVLVASTLTFTVTFAATTIFHTHRQSLRGTQQQGRKASHADPLRSLIDKLQIGDCVNFTNKVGASTAQKEPQIEECRRRSATFRVIWLGVPAANRSCPKRYANPQGWSDGSKKIVCMMRIYHVGQCMQGPRSKRNLVTWYNNAVVNCRTLPTKSEPYVVKIAAITNDDGAPCPGYSNVEPTPDSNSGRSLCIELVRRLR